MIGIIYSRLRLEEKLIMQAFNKLHIEIVQLDPRTLMLEGKPEQLKKITIILDREIGQIRSELLLEYFGDLGITTINSFPAARTCNNKALSTWAFEKAGIPTPKTYVVFSLEEAIHAAEKLSYPVVLKPVIGSWGRLLAKIDNKNTLEAIVEHKEALHNPYHNIFYIQEYIDKPDRDIRIFVIGKEPVAAMYRTSQHWITNTALNGTAKKCTLDKELTALVKKTVNTLNIDIAGIDIIETKTGYQVLEINSTPEFHGLQSVTDIPIAARIAQYIINIAPFPKGG